MRMRKINSCVFRSFVSVFRHSRFKLLYSLKKLINLLLKTIVDEFSDNQLFLMPSQKFNLAERPQG
jgi:hypothetical protein